MAGFLSKLFGGNKSEKDVKKIAEQNWHEPVTVNRSDEIGKLGASIEQMRKRLVSKDEAQQTLLQNISHDLKTPVMVIQSYAQSIQDGIYPKGDLSQTVKVIEDESKNLEKKIRDLLYLTKLDYMSTHQLAQDDFDFTALLHEVVDRLRWRRPEIQWEFDDANATIKGDKELWTKVLENVLDNQLRYAETKVSLSLAKHQTNVQCTISNDGPPIDQSVLQHLFEPFKKGANGEFGIGLSIVKRIVTMHDGAITAENTDTGVTFSLTIPI